MEGDGEIIPFERPLELLDLGPLPPPRVSEKKAKALFATFLLNYSSHATRKAYKEAVSDFIRNRPTIDGFHPSQYKARFDGVTDRYSSPDGRVT